MKLPNKSFLKGFILALVCAGVVYAGVNFGLKYDALKVAWKYSEVVQNLEVENISIATISGVLRK